ncbi:hypothetical protein [Mumia zhuanghuii]|uniref:Uncharacterized protein n=1 Tax=Mumia zhuanghuii TaxID=2585211 RepID=A0A5C4MGG8_9ACTN|nr:hypothetical protein [Mumia zhuanghuii]TNC33506.1 hypothetical protein FHE65_28875 [Mumia zhuanghuii]
MRFLYRRLDSCWSMREEPDEREVGLLRRLPEWPMLEFVATLVCYAMMTQSGRWSVQMWLERADRAELEQQRCCLRLLPAASWAAMRDLLWPALAEDSTDSCWLGLKGHEFVGHRDADYKPVEQPRLVHLFTERRM